MIVPIMVPLSQALGQKMSKLSTDRQILQCIFNLYADAFRAAQIVPHTSGEKIYVPIDVKKVAAELDNDEHILFGRLYYHLDAKHRYKTGENSHVHLFAFAIGENRHCINYPYLAALLAEQVEAHSNDQRNFWLSVAALVFSLGAIVAQVAG
jgi:hypothetical protein